MLVFCEKSFRKNAEPHIVRTISKHLDTIDGIEVMKDENCQWGHYRIEHYEFEGTDYYLYPVLEEWCRNERQMSLFQEGQHVSGKTTIKKS